MKTKDAIKKALTATQSLLPMYLSDLSDADLLVRPVPGANHIAWQIGHLILTECLLVRQQLPESAQPELPGGFAQQHGKETQATDPPAGFATRAEYIDL